MYKAILKDYFIGLLFSIRFDIMFKPLMNNIKLRKLIFKIIKYNILFHFVPFVLINIIERFIEIDLMFLTVIVAIITYFISSIFHVLHFIDLINAVNVYARSTANSASISELISLAIMMAMYQTMITLTVVILDYVTSDLIWIPMFIIKVIILSVYHSFYCYNNLWQYKKIGMILRVDMHEKLWPYYVGYGTFATLIYIFTNHPITFCFYNIYNIVIISIPFMIEPKYPPSEPKYPSINLKIFARAVTFIWSHIQKLRNDLDVIPIKID